MEYVANLMDASQDPSEWARRREDQGWPILSVADHLASANRPFPHVWVSVSAVAAATTRARVTTAFVNNLLRNPVEVAQASLMMHKVAQGRFELGLGAGWLQYEVEAAGIPYPSPADRAGSFVESAQIIRSIMHTGACRFEGRYHTVDISGVGPLGDTPPLLVCSVGGARTVREVTPHADRVELKASSPSTRGGSIDMAVMAAIPDSHLTDLIARVRDVAPDIGIGMFLFCNVGDDEATRNLSAMMGDGLYSRFYGSPSKVVEGIEWLRELGISRCQISPIDDASLDRLAPALFS
jgi:alkanesulfonate monooxygenase SsuD/methylene tetrahydromethanopterin reductase-like flavin-dependent oxidoreductase (luciferase family)